MDKLIRELLVDVKQKGAVSAAKSIEKLANNLQDSAAGAELLNESLDQVNRTLITTEKQSSRLNSTMNKLKAPPGLQAMSKSIKSLDTSVGNLVGILTGMEETMTQGFNNMIKATKNMENNVGRSVDVVGDKITTLNSSVKRSTKNLGENSDAATRASRALGSTSGSARGATREFAAMAKIGGSLPIMYAAIASNLFVLQTAFQNLKEGDQLNRLMEFGTIVGQQTGTPVQNLAVALQEATGYATSFEEAMKQASVASAYGFSSKQLEQFGLVARRAAAVLGIDMTDALNRVIKGVSKQEIELLDELGVTIRLNDAYAAYVKQLNAANTGITYNTDSLTSYQKQQAYANAVIDESTRRFGQLDTVLRATPWEQFAANADSALRQLQMSAAKYLTPVIDSLNTFFYMSKSAASTQAAVAQNITNAGVDPTNTAALVNSLSESKKGIDDALKLQKESLEKRNAMKSQFDAQYEAADSSLQAAVRLGLAGMPNNIANPQNKAWVDQMVLMRNQIGRLDQEVEGSKANVDAWKTAWNTAANQLSKANPELQKTLKLSKEFTSDIPGNSSPIITVDEKALTGLNEITQSYKNLKTTAKDTASSVATIGTGTQTAATAAAGLKDAIATVKSAAAATGGSVDQLTKDLPLGYQSLQEMERAYKSISAYATATRKDNEAELAAEREKNRILASGGKKREAEAAAARIKAQSLDEEIAATKDLMAIVKDSPQLQAQLNKLELQKLQTINSTYHDAAKVKDISDKLVGTEEEIALLNNTTMTSQQYQLANIKLQLKVENERLEVQSKMANKEKAIHDTRKKIAGLDRELREAEYNKAASDINFQAGRTALLSHQQGLGQIASLQAQVNAETKRYADLLIAARANGQVLDDQSAQESRDKITELQLQIRDLKDQQKRSAQDAATSSLGGVHSSTAGMDPETKAVTEGNNKMAFYDQSISKLSEINSAAVSVGQSIGNVINTVGQWAEGSASTLSLVAAGAQSIASVLSYTSQQRISGIDAEIAAEKDRDGQTEESKNKIKRLEAQKIAEQKKAAQQQIAIQTAVAVMMAAANPWPFPAIPMMAAATIAGALAYSQASSATAPSSSSSDDSTKYLSMGERQKTVDTSIAANSGELSYIQDARGIGSANNFTPRAEGGDMLPGVGYLLGEHGPEVVTPKVPMRAGGSDTGSGSNSGGSPTINHWTIQAMDAQSFQEFMHQHAEIVENTVEGSLNTKGGTLRTSR